VHLPRIYWHLACHYCGEEMNMISAVVGTLIILSIGILLTHALEIFRSS